MPTIHIALGAAEHRGYDVVIETHSLDAIASHAGALAPAHRYAVIADSNVASLWGERARGALPDAELFVFDPGERFKTRETWAALTDRMFERGFGRDSAVLALGGGVTGDLAGFVAATYMRGIPVVQLPTTLLAMLDSSIGGKTGVDVQAGKNLVGAFHQPAGVVIDPITLTTLPRGELIGGLAEAVKHGAIADVAYLDWIEQQRDRLLALDAPSLEQLIEGSVRIKGRAVSADEREGGVRASLNFGHTVGHALEQVTGYALHHGHAVAIGMVVEARLGERMGVTANGTAARLAAVLRALGLPTEPPAGIKAEQLTAAMGMDKKARRGKVRATLVAEPGTVARGSGAEWTIEIDARVLRDALARPAEPG